MLVIEGLTRRFGSKAAVDDVSLAVEPGSFVGVIGRSGAGKSTLLRMINRLQDPSRGSDPLEGSGRDRPQGPGPARLAHALRDGLPAVQHRWPARRDDQRADGPAELHLADALAAQALERRRIGPSPCRRSSMFDITDAGRPARRRRSRAASSSAWRLPGRWCRSRRSFWPTSRSPRSTRATPRS